MNWDWREPLRRVRFYLNPPASLQLNWPQLGAGGVQPPWAEELAACPRRRTAFLWQVIARHRSLCQSAAGGGDNVHIASIPDRYGCVLHFFAQHSPPGHALELGTAFGISGLYLAGGLPPSGHLHTLEGSPDRVAVARAGFQRFGLQARVTCYHCDFDQQLPALLARLAPLSCAYIDGNHRREPTERYARLILPHTAPGGYLLFDDIFLDDEMGAAWRTICALPTVGFAVEIDRRLGVIGTAAPVG